MVKKSIEDVMSIFNLEKFCKSYAKVNNLKFYHINFKSKNLKKKTN